jgi:hypothetical protein
MQIDGALITEQGVTFAIVVVKNHVLDSQSSANQARATFAPLFPGVPLVLMGQDGFGTPKYFGRPDIVDFLANIDPSRIPWRRYDVA